MKTIKTMAGFFNWLHRPFYLQQPRVWVSQRLYEFYPSIIECFEEDRNFILDAEDVVRTLNDEIFYPKTIEISAALADYLVWMLLKGLDNEVTPVVAGAGAALALGYDGIRCVKISDGHFLQSSKAFEAKHRVRIKIAVDGPLPSDFDISLF